MICFVLPRLDRFNHVITIDEEGHRSEILQFLRMGDEGYDVAHLQRELYKKGYIEFDDINSRFDDTTLNALNKYLSEHNFPVGTDCTYEAYQAVVLGLEGTVSGSDAVVSGSDQNGSTAENTDESSASETSTTETTNTSSLENGEVRIRFTNTLNLYAEPDVNSTIYYTVQKNGKTYKLFSEYTDSNGKKWYKIRYFVDLDCWIEAEYTEIVSNTEIMN